MVGSMNSCCVPKCGRIRSENVQLHLFPRPITERDRFAAWVNALGSGISSLSPEYIYKNRRICSEHFEPKFMTWKGRLTNIAVPTLLMPGIKVEPLDEQYNTPESADINMEDVKIEVEEHPVASKFGVDVPVFIPCTRQILPKINMFSIVEYFVGNPSFRDIDYKKLKTDIYINAGDTIGFVQLHILDEKITLQGTVAFDKQSSHVCIVRYDNFTHTISYTNCECQRPACQHILAFLLWLHRRCEERLDNDMSFYLEPLVQQTRLLKAQDMRHGSDTEGLSEDLDLPESAGRGRGQGQATRGPIVKTCEDLKMVNSPLYSEKIEENTDDSDEGRNRKIQINDLSDDEKKVEERKRKRRERNKRHRENKKKKLAIPVNEGKRESEKHKNREKSKRYREKKKNSGIEAATVYPTSDYLRQKNAEKCKRYRDKKRMSQFQTKNIERRKSGSNEDQENIMLPTVTENVENYV